MVLPAIADLGPPARFWSLVSSHRLLLVFSIYALVATIGGCLFMISAEIPVKIFGLGLMFPGAGFLAHADIVSLQGWVHYGMAAFGAFVFIFSLVLWLATGNALAPFVTWFFFAVAAASMQHVHHISNTSLWTTIIIISSFLMLFFIMGIAKQCSAYKKRAKLSTWLQQEAPKVAASFASCKPGTDNELSINDLNRMRFLLDRALQPISEFNGFEWLDQFQTAAVRYQINFLGYALSMAQHTYLPAFGGYLNEAQHALIVKLTHHSVWRYWALENSWGNLNANPSENIMYTGFAATQMTMFHNSSRRQDFNEAGSFSLHHPSGQSWEYDLPSLVSCLATMCSTSEYHLIACEPNWIYPLCNTIGSSAIMANSPALWEQQASLFRKNLEREFIDGSGRIIPCRSRYSGLAIPASFGGAVPQAMPCFFLNAIMPDIAMRQWLLLRKRLMDGPRLRRSQFWRIDTGNYRFSRAAAYAGTALAAAEMGDTEIKEACLAALDEECPMLSEDGYFYRPKASVWAHAVEFFARSATPNGFRDLMTLPSPAASEPHIHQATYPDVLIASATYRDKKLRAVLYPGAAAGIYDIQVAGLQPNALYRCIGGLRDAVRADILGNASISVMLDGRTVIELYATY